MNLHFYLIFNNEFNDFKKLNNFLNEIEKILLSKNKKFKIFYDPAVFKNKDYKYSNLLQSEFQNNVFNKIKPINNDERIFNWNLNKLSVKEIYENIIKSLILYYNEDSFLIDFDNKFNNIYKKNKFICFTDNNHNNKLPNTFYHINFFSNLNEINLFLKKNYKDEFSLTNTIRFKKTSKNIQGEHVYKEINTNNYWYFDNFHKNHFEVFNYKMEHIGEADLNGIIDTTKKDNNKKLKL